MYGPAVMGRATLRVLLTIIVVMLLSVKNPKCRIDAVHSIPRVEARVDLDGTGRSCRQLRRIHDAAGSGFCDGPHDLIC